MRGRDAVERVRHRADGGLDLPRARNRVSAFVYGNITVLGALVAVTPDLVRDGKALVVVAATVVTTFLAHVLADLVASRIGEQAPGSQDDGDDGDDGHAHLLAELRDSLPVASAGSWPLVLFALGALDVLPAVLAQVLAAALVVVRLALTGVVVERISGRAPSAVSWWSGLLLALVGTAVAVAKALLTH